MDVLGRAAGDDALRGTLSHPWLRTTNQILAGIWIFLCMIFLLMRLYTKIHIMRMFWWDDVCLILAWMFSIVTQSVVLYGYTYGGYGVHMKYLSPAVLEIYVKTLLSAAIIYIPALAAAKFALLMLYYRLLHMIRIWRIIIFLVTFIIAGYTIALTLGLIFPCQPIAKNWDLTITTGHCVDRSGFYLATAITNTVSDIILIIIPIPVIVKLKLPLIQKLGVGCMFGIGCLTIITSIIRLVTILPLVTSEDQSYEIALAIISFIIEANFIIICPCLPYLKQFLRFHAPCWIGDSGSNSSQSRPSASSNSNSTPSSNRRKPGLIVLQDDIEQALSPPMEAHCACMVGARQGSSTSDESRELMGERK
ncbi:hypothetical protein BO83DRAFT_411832 [Aspergillus eucalypticola CBS 122712]|uniref:Rhodopsin domain-containing protein n=1 Tax=Aspergillus eucalypticola (strain CBS 122712 / IBT 29274) TaxID=1448314 RepID=A0A317UPM1_ASPEC|nr:uncharacterized protein BO83DRAFT_411832 [Aspergillus eucalypticola CBS 122712]PWY63651.1 hypothetical protein BO83DRAFT_411832 [Aspergillus eucalypticola CBS 122712]